MIRGKLVGRITAAKPFQKCLFPSAHCQYAIGSLKCRTCRDYQVPGSQVCRRVLPFRHPKPIKLIKRKEVRVPISQPKPIRTREISVRKIKLKSTTSIPTDRLNKSKMITTTPRNYKPDEGIFMRAQSAKSATPEKVKRSDKKTTEKISKEMESVTGIVKKLQMEVDNLKKKDCGFRSLVASIESNTMGDYNNNKLKAAVTMAFLDEDNAALKEEIQKLQEELEKGKDEVLKKGEDTRKKKAKLVAEITALKKSCKKEVKLKEEKHAAYLEMKQTLGSQAKPSINFWEKVRWESDNWKLRREIERYDPTPPPLKPDPYKTEQHLSLHELKEFEVNAYNRDASRYRIKFQQADKVFEKIDTCMKDQKKKNFILSAVLEELTKLQSDVQHDYPNDNPDLEKMKDEVNALEVSATLNAEKQYAAIEKRELERARNSRPLNSSNPPKDPVFPLEVVQGPPRPGNPPEGNVIPLGMVQGPPRPSNPPEGNVIPLGMVQGPPRPSNPPEGNVIPFEVVQGPPRPSNPQEGSSSGAQRNLFNIVNFGAGCSYH